MLPTTLWILCLTAIHTNARTTSTSTTSHTTTSQTSSNFFSQTYSTISDPSTPVFTGTQYTYPSYPGQSTLLSSSSASSSGNQSTQTTKKKSVTHLGALTTNGTSTSTSSANPAQNTVPCNQYPEFCNRKYSNITQVCAHNSAFVVPNNAGSNQMYGIIDQLNDGVRMLQGETHWVNSTIMNCHTSCSLLDAGPWQGSLELLRGWIEQNPYDVVTWLIVNSDFVSVEKYVSAIQDSGLGPYLYTPAYVPQRKDQWPTLGEMILSGNRVVLFMDYNANQTAVPYVLDEFAHIWETPFSPTNRSFPCSVQRPPRLAKPQQQQRAKDEFMYLANHNLNTAVDLGALLGSGVNAGAGTKKQEILIPNTAYINVTNGEYDQFGQLGAMTLNCTSDWDRPPNFLLVDYYNYGDPKPGSVFEVAARANGVTYNRKCCGPNDSMAAAAVRVSLLSLCAAALFAAVLML